MKFNVCFQIVVLDILILGHGFLVIKEHATKGKNATLICNFPVPNVYLVLWNNTKGIQAVCEDSGFCGNITERRYHPSMHTDHSLFYITDADHNVDEGIWSCQINNQYASSKEVIVYSLPASFYIEKPSSLLNEITVTGKDQIELEVVAVCVYPLENNVYLQYKIKGDSTFNYYTKRAIEILSRTGQSNCLDHEFVVTARITILEIDFDRLTIYFQFQYQTTFGYVLNTRRMITAVFKENPCQSNLCLNGGTCRFSAKQFFCDCSPRFKGQYCETEVNPCDLHILCKNGATCHSNLNTYEWTCKCTPGYTGELCDKKEAQPKGSSSNRKTFDPVMLVLLPLFIFWLQPSESWFFNMCIEIYLFHVIFLWRVNGNVDLNNKLLIGVHPTEGTKGVISCRIYAITENVLVQWSHNNVTITCKLPESTCTHNQFYSASISSTFSNLTVWKAKFARDNGLWICIVNNLTSVGTLYVVTEPRKFVMEDGNLKNLTRNNWTLTAEAYCVYPDLAHTSLLYQVKGDVHYQQFKRRNLSIHYDNGKMYGCENNEYVLRATGMIKKSDFSSELLVRFKFHYESLSGNKNDTIASDFLMFTDDPCHFVSCKNGGHCKLDAKHDYKCICVNFFSGNHCEDSPQISDRRTIPKTNNTGIVCCWIIIPCVLFPIIGISVYKYRKAKSSCKPPSSGEPPLMNETDSQL